MNLGRYSTYNVNRASSWFPPDARENVQILGTLSDLSLTSLTIFTQYLLFTPWHPLNATKSLLRLLDVAQGATRESSNTAKA